MVKEDPKDFVAQKNPKWIVVETGRAGADRGRDKKRNMAVDWQNTEGTRQTSGHARQLFNCLMDFTGETQTHLEAHKDVRTWGERTNVAWGNQYSRLKIESNGKNRPFAASHSRGIKPPRWREKVALGQDKQKTYIIVNGNFLCFSCPGATLLSSTAVLYHVNG